MEKQRKILRTLDRARLGERVTEKEWDQKIVPKTLREVGVKEEDIDFLADSAIADACAPGNPKEATKADIIALYQSMM